MAIENILPQIIADNALHAKWLNTLSMMENCGARKIAACEHPQEVSVSMLKHASEESRHAYYLKTQIKKLGQTDLNSYLPEEIMAPMASYQYLHRLDMQISRYLKTQDIPEDKLKYASYLLTTFAIEERADELYPIYAEELDKQGSSISVRMIIAEEQGHLEEMLAQMAGFFDDWEPLAKHATQLESELYAQWMRTLEQELTPTDTFVVAEA